MDFKLWAAIPALLPLLPQIEKAIATAQRILNDPEVKEALETAAKVTAIVDQAEKSS